MTTLVMADVGVLVKIVKGNGDWYMVYVGGVLAIQVEKNKDMHGYFFKELRVSRCCNLPLVDAMNDALQRLHLPELQHKSLMDSFKFQVERMKEAA